jgi:hypothetical protein
MFPKLKGSLKGYDFISLEDIQGNVLRVLKGLLENYSHNFFHEQQKC